MNAKDIGNRIKQLRLKKGISTNELAAIVGASNSAIEAYEKGERVPRDEIKVRISAAFNKELADIFY